MSVERSPSAPPPPPARPKPAEGRIEGVPAGRRRIAALALAAALFALGSLAGESRSQASEDEKGLTIRFETDSLQVSGATPGGKVVWFGVAREIDRYPVRLVRHNAVVVDLEGRGEITLELDRDVPWQSVWVAVDLESGAFELATPEGFDLREVPIPAGALRPGAGGVGTLADGREILELLLVRPGTGAWGATVGDGGINDATGVSNGRFELRLTRMRPVAEGPDLSPPVFKPGDVVVGIDPRSMEVYAARLVPGGAQ